MIRQWLLFLWWPIFGGDTRIITMEFSPRAGFFAVMNVVIGEFVLFEKGAFPDVTGIAVDFKEFGLYYDPSRGSNWWNYYFEPIGDGLKGHPIYPSGAEYAKAYQQRRNMTHSEVAAFVKKYIRVKQSILDQVELFRARHFQESFVIGVHYRGTDKKKEAPRVPYEKVFEKISECLPLDQPYQIFVATDEEAFLSAIKEVYPHRVIATDAARSSSEVGVHFLNKHQYDIGEEALIDALLLSKCDLLIRTSSSLSLWSTYFNPDMPTHLLNRRFHKSKELE
jgi:hypothetical protein